MTTLSISPCVNDTLAALCIDLFINPSGVQAMAAIFARRARDHDVSFKDLISAIASASICIEIMAVNTGVDSNAIYLFPFGMKLLPSVLCLDVSLLVELGRWRTARALSHMIALLTLGFPIFKCVMRGTTASLNLNDVTFKSFLLNDRVAPHADMHYIASHILSIAASMGEELPWQDSADIIATLPSRNAAKKATVIETVRQWRKMVTELHTPRTDLLSM